MHEERYGKNRKEDVNECVITRITFSAKRDEKES